MKKILLKKIEHLFNQKWVNKILQSLNTFRATWIFSFILLLFRTVLLIYVSNTLFKNGYYFFIPFKIINYIFFVVLISLRHNFIFNNLFLDLFFYLIEADPLDKKAFLKEFEILVEMIRYKYNGFLIVFFQYCLEFIFWNFVLCFDSVKIIKFK